MITFLEVNLPNSLATFSTNGSMLFLVSEWIQTRERLTTFLKGSKLNLYSHKLSYMPKPKQNRIKPEFYSSLQLLWHTNFFKWLVVTKGIRNVIYSAYSERYFARTEGCHGAKIFPIISMHERKGFLILLQLLTLVWWLKWLYNWKAIFFTTSR